MITVCVLYLLGSRIGTCSVLSEYQATAGQAWSGLRPPLENAALHVETLTSCSLSLHPFLAHTDVGTMCLMLRVLHVDGRRSCSSSVSQAVDAPMALALFWESSSLVKDFARSSV